MAVLLLLFLIQVFVGMTCRGGGHLLVLHIQHEALQNKMTKGFPSPKVLYFPVFPGTYLPVQSAEHHLSFCRTEMRAGRQALMPGGGHHWRRTNPSIIPRNYLHTCSSLQSCSLKVSGSTALTSLGAIWPPASALLEEGSKTSHMGLAPPRTQRICTENTRLFLKTFTSF